MALKAAAAALEIELQPAGSASVRAAYEMLADSYQTKNVEDQSKRSRLWVTTFQDWPHCALQAAVKAWAMRDTPYMPSPGQFHACGAGVIQQKRADLSDLYRIIRFMNREPDPWETKDADPEIAGKLRRLAAAMRNGEDLEKLQKAGEI